MLFVDVEILMVILRFKMKFMRILGGLLGIGIKIIVCEYVGILSF